MASFWQEEGKEKRCMEGREREKERQDKAKGPFLYTHTHRKQNVK